MSLKAGQGPRFANDSWYVPPHTVDFFDGATSDAVIVIPVINEGERIAELLERMTNLSIASAADVVLVDGGSTDGSVHIANLRQLEVRGLLTHQGDAGLSAQLQVAYSFCVKAGYEFIVTIDGNNKDDPAGIDFILEKLRVGFDFVQGSRFIAGGFHKNTPFSRLFAVRMIHAPLLSLASGFRWTDTTQGFRGYRVGMLRDSRLAVFREGFSKYSLLMYLSYRAPKLGFKITEVGTSRIYPTGGVPTKIKGVRGKIELFWDLVRVCVGRCNPPPSVITPLK